MSADEGGRGTIGKRIASSRALFLVYLSAPECVNLAQIRGRSRNFGKGGPVRGRNLEPSAGGGSGGLPRKF